MRSLIYGFDSRPRRGAFARAVVRFATPIVVALIATSAAGFAQTATTAPTPTAAPAPQAFAPLATPTPGGPVYDPVTVPAGTPLKIALIEKLASNSAHAGDRFTFRSVDAVVVDGYVAIPASSTGEGQVVSAESAGGNGHPGKLALQFDWIYGADNLTVRLSDVPSANDGEAAKGAASTAAIASYLVLGPLGLFAHNFVHGKDVIVQTDRKIPVYVAQSVHITPTTKVTTADGFAH